MVLFSAESLVSRIVPARSKPATYMCVEKNVKIHSVVVLVISCNIKERQTPI